MSCHFKNVQKNKNGVYVLYIYGNFWRGGYWLGKHQYYLYFNFDLGLLACLFICLGMVFRKYQILDKLEKKWMFFIALFVFLFFGGAYFKGELPINWPTRKFPELWILFVCPCVTNYFYVILCDTLIYRRTGRG